MQDPANCRDETYWREQMGSSACFHEIFDRNLWNCVACFIEISSNARDALNANWQYLACTWLMLTVSNVHMHDPIEFEVGSCRFRDVRPPPVQWQNFSMPQRLRLSNLCAILSKASGSVIDNRLHPSRRSHSSWPRKSKQHNFDGFDWKFHNSIHLSSSALANKFHRGKSQDLAWLFGRKLAERLRPRAI